MRAAELKQDKRPIPDGFIEALQQQFGERCSLAAAVREQHGTDESPYPTMAPDAVVFAHDTEEVAWLARHCHEHRVPLIPYGAGTSLEGPVLALHGGGCVEWSALDGIWGIQAAAFS